MFMNVNKETNSHSKTLIAFTIHSLTTYDDFSEKMSRRPSFEHAYNFFYAVSQKHFTGTPPHGSLQKGQKNNDEYFS